MGGDDPVEKTNKILRVNGSRELTSKEGPKNGSGESQQKKNYKTGTCPGRNSGENGLSFPVGKSKKAQEGGEKPKLATRRSTEQKCNQETPFQVKNGERSKNGAGKPQTGAGP